MSEISDVTPPTDDKLGDDKTRKATTAAEGEPRGEVFDLAKMSPRDIATELARRSKQPSARPLPAAPTESFNENGEHLTASGLSDREVAAFFAPMPRLFGDRREHDHNDPAYLALREKMTAAAADDEADEHDPMDALSKALASRLAARTVIATEVTPAAADEPAPKARAAEKISAVLAKAEVAPMPAMPAPALNKAADDLTMPPMPGPQVEPRTDTLLSPRIAPEPLLPGLPDHLMASPLHITALMSPLPATDPTTGLPRVPHHAAEKPVIDKPAGALSQKQPSRLEAARLETVRPEPEKKPDITQSIAAALAANPAMLATVTDELPSLLSSPIMAPPTEEDRAQRHSGTSAQPASIRLIKASGRTIPVQPLLERLRGLQQSGFRWDILAGGVLVGAVLAALPVIFLMPRHAAIVPPADQVAAAPATPAPAAGAPDAGAPGAGSTTAAAQPETIVPPPPPVPVIAPTATALTQEQADKLLQSAQSLSTAAGPTTAPAATTPTGTTPAGDPATTAKSATATPAAKPAGTTAVSTTVKKPATTKKKSTKPKPVTTDPPLSPAKR